MESEDKSLENYIKKLLELQNHQEESVFSDIELANIADELGVSQELINKHKETYLERGKNHLVVKNWQEAIQDFEQLLTLSPKNEQGLAGLAVAYYGKSNIQDKVENREKALMMAMKCLEYYPKNTQAAQIIFLIQNITPNIKKSFVKVGVTLAIVLLLGVFLTTYFLFQSPKKNNQEPIENTKETTASEKSQTNNQASIIGENQRIATTLCATGEKGGVFWVILDEQGQEKIEKRIAKIINPISQEVIKTVILAENIDANDYLWKFPFELEGKFYTFTAQNTFEARDPHTGEIVENEEILKNKFSELGVGIAETKMSGGSLEIITRDGREFVYYPIYRRIFAKEQKEKTSGVPQQKDLKAFHYNWTTQRDQLRKEFVLLRTEGNIFFYTDRRNQQVSEMRNDDFEKIQKAPNNSQVDYNGIKICDVRQTFLKGKLIYGDSSFALIRHYSEIDDTTPTYTCIDGKTGKIRWEIPNVKLEISKTLYFTQNEDSFYNISVCPKTITLHKTFVAIDTKRYKNANFACEIDLLTGKILWDYSPDYEIEVSKN